MLTIVQADGTAERKQIEAMRIRAAEKNAGIDRSAAEIMEAVRIRGYEAVREYSLKFDNAEPREIPLEELKTAAERIPTELLNSLRKSAENIKAYQSELLSTSRTWESPVSGGMVGQIVRGLSRVGIYVPGGRAAYPSSVLMNAVPAKVAGCQEIIMVTPPTENLNDAVLAAAWVAGVDRCIAVGGVQAVAALTYGADWIPRVDKLVGPGNAYVSAAKRMAYGTLDIDMVAGPSEVLVIADETADPVSTAADLLSQAEHDPMASAILLTTDQGIAEAVAEEIDRFIEKLPRTEIICQSIENYGYIFVGETMDDLIDAANTIASEHLEIITENAFEVMTRIRHAGAIFLGSYSSEPLGDYYAGPNHILPTNGTARFFSPLGVDAFIKKSSIISYSKDALRRVHRDIEIFAENEGLYAHANSISVRFEEE